EIANLVQWNNLTRFIGSVSSLREREGKTDVGAPHQRQVVEAVSGVDLVGAPCRRQQNSLPRKPHIKVRLELDRLCRATFQPTATIGSVARKALSEYLHQKRRVR